MAAASGRHVARLLFQSASVLIADYFERLAVGYHQVSGWAQIIHSGASSWLYEVTCRSLRWMGVGGILAG